MHNFTAGSPFTTPNPVSAASRKTFSAAGTYDICQYIKFWWNGRVMTFNGTTGLPVDIIVYAFPTTTSNRSEFMIIDSETNHLKET